MIDDEGYIHVMSRSDDIINVAAHRFSTGTCKFLFRRLLVGANNVQRFNRTGYFISSADCRMLCGWNPRWYCIPSNRVILSPRLQSNITYRRTQGPLTFCLYNALDFQASTICSPLRRALQRSPKTYTHPNWGNRVPGWHDPRQEYDP